MILHVVDRIYRDQKCEPPKGIPNPNRCRYNGKNIEELMTAAFATYFKDGVIDATSKELFTNDDSETEKIEYLTGYDENWCGSIIVFVTPDNNNKFNIADYYLTGGSHK